MLLCLEVFSSLVMLEATLTLTISGTQKAIDGQSGDSGLQDPKIAVAVAQKQQTLPDAPILSFYQQLYIFARSIRTIPPKPIQPI